MKRYNRLTGLLVMIFVVLELCCPQIIFAQQVDDSRDRSTEWYEERCGLKEDEEVYRGIVDDETVYSTGTKLTSPKDAYWKKFSSDYFYNQLSEKQKRVWDDLDAVCLNIINGSQDVGEYTELIQNNDYLSKEQILEIAHLFRISNPQYYFLTSSVSYWTLVNNPSIVPAIALEIYPEFRNGQARRQATEKFKSRIDEWIEIINTGEYDEGKEKIAYDLLIKNTKYEENALDQTAYSLICNGKTVCAGYTNVMQLLMNAVGIDTVYMQNPGVHAWNLIKLHGEWYAVDVTWGDQDDEKIPGYYYGISYDYYNKSDITIQMGNDSHQTNRWKLNLCKPPAAKYDSVLEQITTQYCTPYFSEGNYIYFMVNDNNRLNNRYVKPIDVLDVTETQQMPETVSHSYKNYFVKDRGEADVRSFVRRLYTLVLQRDAEKQGLEAWTRALFHKESGGVDIGYGFVFSDECKEKNLSNEDFVEILYNTFMNRPSDEGGKTAWVSQLDAGVEREKVFEGFIGSVEFAEVCTDSGINVGSVNDVGALAAALSHYRNQNADITKFVARCYTEALGREYEPDGLEAWCKVIIERSNTPKQVAQNFIFSDEFLEKNLNSEQYVKVLYRTFMGREADEGGLAAWVEVLESGREDRAKVLEGFSDSAEFDGILQLFGLSEKKQYATVEDWYKDNRQEFAAIEDEANAGSTDGKMTIYCEGNVIVYKLEMYENLFDGGEEMNALVKTTFDSMFEEQRDTYINLIDSISENSGIDASMISIRIDIFDPTTTTEPGYSYEFRK